MKERIDLRRFADELNALANKPVKKGCVLFYGSSTFGIWKELEQVFADYNAVNCGFGGSTAHEGWYNYECVAARQQPSVMVWYYGDNDPVCGYTAQETEQLYVETWNKFRKDFPQIKIVTIATKTSPARNEYAEYVGELNAWQKDYAAQHSDWLTFVDTSDICKKDGEYLLENYLPDQLHFGEKGYAILTKKLKAVLDKIYTK